MITVSFPLNKVDCLMKLGTARCRCVKELLHEVGNRSDAHMCVCGASWFTQRTTGIITSVENEPDYEHPHEEFAEEEAYEEMVKKASK